MLIEFKVEGFKNFEKELVFDLSKTRNYNFNENAIKDGGNVKAIVVPNAEKFSRK